MLEILAFESGPVATFAYLVMDREAGDAVIIDAPLDSAARIIEAADAAGVVPGALILTHTHWDHTGDAAILKRRYPEMLIYVHHDDQYRLADPMKHSVWKLPFTIEPVEADRHLAHGETFRLGSIVFNVIHTPGHTEGGICLYDRGNGVLFAGDTLFAGSVGRTDLPGGDWNTLARSIRERLLDLPDDVRVYPGHGPATTIGEERASNPFVGE
ncbi:MAG: MBL fold metallo-hydrolase [Bacteroidetes bacterium]|nr:MBL fold metallo-hydrolase [Bacteroidota bacterium]